MKILTLSLCLAILFFTSCTKTTVEHDITTVHDTTTIIVHDTTTVTDTIKTNFAYLTARTWMYNKLYSGYVNASNTGTLEYQRGSTTNLQNFDAARLTYNSNGTIAEIRFDGSSVPGTWTMDLQQTVLTTINSYGTFPANIVAIDDKHWIFFSAATGGNQSEYAELIPAP